MIKKIAGIAILIFLFVATESCIIVTDKCEDECTKSGEIMCVGDHSYKECGDYDGDVCLEWSSIQDCSGDTNVCIEFDTYSACKQECTEDIDCPGEQFCTYDDYFQGYCK